MLVAGAVAFFSFDAPGDSTPKATFTPPILGGQPPNALVLGQESGDLAVGLAIQPTAGRLLLVATVIGQAGTGVPDLATRFTVTTVDARTTTAADIACTPGCYEATIATTSRPTRATITLGSGEPIGFALPAQ